MRYLLTLALLASPALASAQQPTVEVNLAALSQISVSGIQFAMRPPAPRFEGFTPPPAEAEVAEAHAEPEEAKPEGNKILPFAGDFTGNVGVTTEYVFRGITQSREAPAIQGGVDYADPSGAYAGLWASSVDFGDGDQASTEFDYYGGYKFEVAQGISLDFGGIYYNYPAADSARNYDFVEGYAGAETAFGLMGHEVTTRASLNVSPDYFAASGPSYYAKLGAKTEIMPDITLDGRIARQWIDDRAAFGVPTYDEWGTGLAYALDGFNVRLDYIDTSLKTSECADGCDAKGVLSLSRSL